LPDLDDVRGPVVVVLAAAEGVDAFEACRRVSEASRSRVPVWFEAAGVAAESLPLVSAVATAGIAIARPAITAADANVVAPARTPPRITDTKTLPTDFGRLSDGAPHSATSRNGRGTG
jgi:hypothetical protein